MSFLKRVKVIFDHIKGPFKCAVEGGLVCGKNVTVMGGANFGSEPYLIKEIPNP